MNLLNDVNLKSIEISKNGKDIIFNFLDMFKGQPLSIIKCFNVKVFNYHNIFEEDDEGFVCYICEVTCCKIEKKDIADWVNKSQFKFADIAWINYMKLEFDVWYLNIESGEISINLLCKKIEKDNRIIF